MGGGRRVSLSMNLRVQLGVVQRIIFIYMLLTNYFKEVLLTELVQFLFIFAHAQRVHRRE